MKWVGLFVSSTASLYISKLELVTSLFRSCLCSELLCNCFSAWRIWIPATQCKRSRIFENCKYIVISVCSEERIPVFNYCLSLAEHARCIYLYDLISTSLKRKLNPKFACYWYSIIGLWHWYVVLVFNLLLIISAVLQIGFAYAEQVLTSEM